MNSSIIISIIQVFFKIQTNMSEQEKKRQRINDFLTPKLNQSFFVYHKQRKIF